MEENRVNTDQSRGCEYAKNKSYTDILWNIITAKFGTQQTKELHNRQGSSTYAPLN